MSGSRLPERDPAILPALERYRPLVPHWQAFVEVLAEPLPGCVWANPLRLDGERLRAILQADGLQPRPLTWLPGAFRLPAGLTLGGRWWYQAGLAHSQEEVSLLPVKLLDPQPGERILDLCAAPGGKTAQLALAVGSQGTVVANDVGIGRLRPLQANIERLGLMNVSTTVCNGAGFPGKTGAFDRVLVDAPCSCEGTLRKHDGPFSAGAEVSLRHSRTQRALLRRAVALCRPGGRVVYSTCTFAPEENECVVDAILQEFGDALRLLPARLAGFEASAGVTDWQGRRLAAGLHHTLRIWPHQNDTGGFFIAVLEKAPGGDVAATDDDRAEPAGVPAPELRQLLAERFGVPEPVLAGWIVHRRSNRGLHCMPAAHRPPLRPVPETTGLKLITTKIRPPKPSTAGAQIVAPYATCNLVELVPDQVGAYLNRQGFPVGADQTRTCTGSGYVIVRYQGFGLGTAYLDTAICQLHSLFPKRG